MDRAIKYWLKDWETLIRFLQVSGILICNIDRERVLRIAIRDQKTWLIYKTEYGATIGGVITSIIFTSELNDINPFDALVALEVHKHQIVKDPGAWLLRGY